MVLHPAQPVLLAESRIACGADQHAQHLALGPFGIHCAAHDPGRDPPGVGETESGLDTHVLSVLGMYPDHWKVRARKPVRKRPVQRHRGHLNTM